MSCNTSNQFHRLALHVVVDVDVTLGGCNVGVPHQTCQQSHTHALVSQCCDERAAPTVTTATHNARPLVHVVEVLGQRIG